MSSKKKSHVEKTSRTKQHLQHVNLEKKNTLK
jgi:hypothetical protein